MMRIPLAFLFILITPALAFAQGSEAFLCKALKSTGFRFDETTQEWRMAAFDVENKQYIIAKPKPEDIQSSDLPIVWRVGELADAFNTMDCPEDFSASGLLICEGDGIVFRFNKTTKRYLIYYYGGGYLSGDDLKDTPFTEIGACSGF